MKLDDLADFINNYELQERLRGFNFFKLGKKVVILLI